MRTGRRGEGRQVLVDIHPRAQLVGHVGRVGAVEELAQGDEVGPVVIDLIRLLLIVVAVVVRVVPLVGEVCRELPLVQIAIVV